MKKYSCDHSTLSLAGTDKDNEDCLGVFEGAVSCFVLADGLGGHGNGALASRLAVQAVCETCKSSTELNRDLAERCFTAAQCAVVKAQQEKDISCRTTMVLLLTDGRKALYGHIGDSRVYHVRKKRIVGRTLDHSVPQMLLNMGSITEDQLAHHPERNHIVRAVGGEGDGFMFELSPLFRLRGKDRFLLCSDGFWEWITYDDIISAVSALMSGALFSALLTVATE